MSDLRDKLRKLRADKGLTQDQAGAAVNVSGSLIAAFESNRIIPQPDTAVRLDQLFGTGDEIQWAAADAREEGRAPLATTVDRPRATMLRCFELSVIPGLLQTVDYAWHLLTDVGPVADVETTLAARLARQEVLTRIENPARLVAVLDEEALRRMVGSPQVMAKQLEAIVAASSGRTSGCMWCRLIPVRTPDSTGRSCSARSTVGCSAFWTAISADR